MRLLVPAVLLLVVRLASADARLAIDAGTTLDAGGTTLRLTVRNTGDAPARGVHPAIHHQGRTHDAPPRETLAPGDAHAWTVVLPRPGEPGTVPAVIEIGFTDTAGTRRTDPHVVTVTTPGLPAADVAITLAATPVRRYGHATLTLDNRGPVPIHGRVVLALPGDLTTEPVSQPADVPAGQRIVLPVVLQRHGDVRQGGLPAFAFFDYGLDGRRHVVVAGTTLEVGPPLGPVSPLVVGGLALGLALAALAVASRVAARRRARRPPEPPLAA